MKAFPSSDPERWEKISAKVGTRSVVEVKKRVKVSVAQCGLVPALQNIYFVLPIHLPNGVIMQVYLHAQTCVRVCVRERERVCVCVCVCV